MHWKETGGVDELFNLPGRRIRARVIIADYLNLQLSLPTPRGRKSLPGNKRSLHDRKKESGKSRRPCSRALLKTKSRSEQVTLISAYQRQKSVCRDRSPGEHLDSVQIRQDFKLLHMTKVKVLVRLEMQLQLTQIMLPPWVTPPLRTNLRT